MARPLAPATATVVCGAVAEIPPKVVKESRTEASETTRTLAEALAETVQAARTTQAGARAACERAARVVAASQRARADRWGASSS
jgi:hypothetical protein